MRTSRSSGNTSTADKFIGEVDTRLVWIEVESILYKCCEVLVNILGFERAKSIYSSSCTFSDIEI